MINTQCWELNLVQKLMTIIRCAQHSNCKMNIILLTKGNNWKIRLELKVVTERKKCHFYFIFFSEAKSKSWNNISLKIAQCEPSIFVFYPEKKQSLAWFSKLDHVRCEILRLKDTLARVLCTQQKKSMGQSRFSLPLGVENVSVTWWKIMWKTYQINSIATVKEYSSHHFLVYSFISKDAA